MIQLAFGLTSDPGFEASGWNLDNVCLVTTSAACGNGLLETGETCDDGNPAGGDGCSASCQDEVGGGCCGVAGRPAVPAALALVTLGIALRRRRSYSASPSLRDSGASGRLA
jgi:cysteine-rich repeat protein